MIPEAELNNGVKIPVLGLGTYKATGEEAYKAVLTALKLGYRHIDTAAYYGNEEEVGKAVKDSGIPREEIFITTKIWNDEHGDPEKAFENSLSKLGMKYVDLYLIHWPVYERVSTWKVMEKIYRRGRARAIGVSNFMVSHLTGFLPECSVMPAVNQIEMHPFMFQRNVVEFCKEKSIQITAYAPLCRGRHFDDERIKRIAEKHGKSAGQVHLRWAVQHGAAVIPKSVHEERIRENMEIFDFELDDEDMMALDSIREEDRVAPDPNMLP